MIVVKDKNMNDIGILENAHEIPVERVVNEVWQSSFSLPLNDPKNELCSHLNFIEITGESGRYYGLYRIMPTQTLKNESNESITYRCEHVFSTLLDDVMDGYFQYSGYTTAQVLQYILNLQETKRWVLGRVDFIKYFEYSFENENGLLAPILSIPKPFNEPYEFTFDTTVYPWVLNLVSVSDEVKSEIRWGKDMISFDEVSDPSGIVNYLIPKGFGEGINQLDISRVNGGKKYVKDDVSISKWGKRSYIWIDKSCEDASTLLANSQSLLKQWAEPKISFSIDSADLSILPEYAHEQKKLNTVTRIMVDDKEYLARIIGEEIPDISKEYDVRYQINNKLDDIATTQADLERRQQVNDAYSQGATNIMTFSNQDNCDPLNPVSIIFYIDDDIVNVNTCDITYRTKPFRAYSKGAESAAQIAKSTDTATFGELSLGSGPAQLYQGSQMTLENHNHYTKINGTWWNHSHGVVIPGHTHDIIYGISTLDSVSPSSLVITVDGTIISDTSTSADGLNLINYLTKQNGKVTRGLHEITIKPKDAIARIEANVILRVFIQSRLGGVY